MLLAWTPGGLPPGSERRIEAIRGVEDATTVVAGLEWIHRAEDGDGAVLTRPPDGLAVPFEVAVIEPQEYARFVYRPRLPSSRRSGPESS